MAEAPRGRVSLTSHFCRTVLYLSRVEHSCCAVLIFSRLGCCTGLRFNHFYDVHPGIRFSEVGLITLMPSTGGVVAYHESLVKHLMFLKQTFNCGALVKWSKRV